jgi:polysaccharide pyruvyl transferase WcaK-like protein
MIIELRGVEFHNKGAELMLLAILEKVRSRYPSAVFVMEVSKITPLEKQRKLGIYAKLEVQRLRNRGRSIGQFGFLTPAFLKRNGGMITENDVDVVLDGSGFAFGDFWGPEYAQRRLSNCIERWKKAGKKVILLPQAFGRFEDVKLQREMRTIIRNADLIFARDRFSYGYLRGVQVNDENTFLRPDFTNLIAGKLPSYFDAQQMQVAIIPNNKLVQSGVFSSKAAYVHFLKRMVEIVALKGKKPFFLIHEGKKDLHLAEHVNADFQMDIPILVEDDPLAVKGIIGMCEAVITSRFHGLVSALTQSIPCLCIGWSHKYLALMEDYNYAEGLLVDDDMEGERLSQKIAMILDEDSALEIKKKLAANAAIQKDYANAMWEQVFELLEEDPLKKSLASKSRVSPFIANSIQLGSLIGVAVAEGMPSIP